MSKTGFVPVLPFLALLLALASPPQPAAQPQIEPAAEAGLQDVTPDTPDPKAGPKKHGVLERLFVSPNAGFAYRRTNSVFLGVEVRAVDAGLAAQLGLDKDAGVLVGHVVEASPAQKAGLREHDLVLNLDGHPVNGPADFARRLREMKEGQRIRLAMLRRGKALELVATLEQRSPLDPLRLKPFLREGGILAVPIIPEIEVTDAPDVPGETIIRFRDLRWPEGGVPPESAKVSPARMPALPGKAETGPAEMPALPGKVAAGSLALRQAVIVARSDEGVFTLMEGAGNRLLTVKDPQGNLVFKGPVSTPQQRAKLPARLRERLDQITVEVKLPAANTGNVRELLVLPPQAPPDFL